MKQLKLYLQLTICAITLSLWATSNLFALESKIGMVNPAWGYASITNKDSKYFRFTATFNGPAEKSYIFTLDNCILYGSDGQLYKKPYIAVAGASKGSRTRVGPGVYMNRLRIEKETGTKPSESSFMDTVKIDKPQGEFEFLFGENGYFTFEFFWAVPENFKPGRIKLLDSFELDLKQVK